MRLYRSILALAALCLMPIGVAEAGAVFVLETSYADQPGKTEAYRMVGEGPDLMIETPSESGGNSKAPDQMIFFGKRNEMLVINHAEKTYMVMDKASIKAMNDASIERGELAVLSPGERIEVIANQKKSARFILVAGKPLNEPVVKYGPFVMNTQDEIRQAVVDYQSGKF